MASLFFYEMSRARDTGFDIYLEIQNRPVNGDVYRLLRPFLFYDSDYFLEIVFNGYNYDKQHAFFPGYPLVLKTTAKMLEAANIVNFDINGVIIANLLLSFICVVIILLGLQQIGRSIYQNEKIVHLTLCAFVFNPCGLYYTSLYSEALFLAIQTVLLAYVYTSTRNDSFGFFKGLLATSFVFFGGFVRSNGFLSLGYVLYFYVISNFRWRVVTMIKTAVFIILTSVISFIPFFAIQLIAAKYLCYINDYEFCSKALPFNYGYLQKKYWGVYFMSFVEGRQIPNILFIVPLIYVIGIHIRSKLSLQFLRKFGHIVIQKKPKDADDYNMPSYYLLGILGLMGLTMIHFNSLTRIVSAYPFFYLFIAEAYMNANERQKKLIRFWFIGFQLFVSVFAVNNYHPM